MGDIRQIYSSATLFIMSFISTGATGTATIIFLGDSLRKARTAARILAPVAIPSSTRITILFFKSGKGLSPR